MVKSLEKCREPVHEAAYMLDPKYDRAILSGEEINDAYGVITVMSDHLGLDKRKGLGSLANQSGSHASIYLQPPGGRDLADLKPLHL